MDSNVGLSIQCAGIGLVTLLSFFVLRSIRGASQRYWVFAWACLSLSLASLVVAFHAAHLKTPFYTLYFFGEYAFGFLFAAGCRHHATHERLTRRRLLWLAPFAALALALPHLSEDFNNLFMAQAAVMACLFAASLAALRPALRPGASGPGARVMSAALFLLALDFMHYVPIFGARDGAFGFVVPAGYLQYTSILDLILEILLGFGTVMVVMERVRHEVEAANRELAAARERAELLARVDPLTDALNRHAFHSLLGRDGDRATVAGCVGVVDLDDLKLINDTHGHAAGDRAIRAVAHAVRSVVRADDQLFRWGGDEFLVLLFGAPEELARRRLESMNDILARTCANGTHPPATVSHSLARFDGLADLQRAIEQADASMYRRKQSSKSARPEGVNAAC